MKEKIYKGLHILGMCIGYGLLMAMVGCGIYFLSTGLYLVLTTK
jgi:hypothetical protein